MKFDLVPAHEIADELAPNLSRHHSEMHVGDDNGDLNIDWDAFFQASLAGKFVAVTLRNEGKLVGYSLFLLGNNPRHKHILEAQGCGIHIEKEFRGQGLKLVRKADELLKAIGIQKTEYILNDSAMGKLLSRCGYKPNYTIWSYKYG